MSDRRSSVFNTLSGRFLLLTVAFVMLAEVLIFVPSVARFRADYLLLRLEKAQIAALATLATDEMISADLERELLTNAEVFNVVLRRDEVRQLVLSSEIPQPIYATYDLRMAGPMTLIRDAISQILDPANHVIRVIGNPVQDAGLLIEITMETAPLRTALIDYGARILVLSALISAVTAILLFLAVRKLLVMPIRRVVNHMTAYAAAPEDARRIIEPTSRVIELREAEDALQGMQTQLTGLLRQKDRLAQLGGAVAKISHDLRNILTTAQLFADRMEGSADPVVARAVPKLEASIRRAVALCESTLAFGRAEEPPPTLSRFALRVLADEVAEAEGLGPEGTVSCLVDVAPGLMVRADFDQLYRVLSNLIRNAKQAIEATGAPGTIEISGGEDDSDCGSRSAIPAPAFRPRRANTSSPPSRAGRARAARGLGLRSRPSSSGVMVDG